MSIDGRVSLLEFFLFLKYAQKERGKISLHKENKIGVGEYN